jgi:hypothetical protein
MLRLVVPLCVSSGLPFFAFHHRSLASAPMALPHFPQCAKNNITTTKKPTITDQYAMVDQR